jgi:hypothetical protein
MVGAQAFQMDNSYEPDYGMDSYDNKKSYGKDCNNYYKSKDSSSISVKKIKCNNINVNVNGFNGVEVGTLPTALNGLADEAQATDEGEVGTSSFGSDSGRPSGSDTDSRLVCINNNDFAVVEEEPTTATLKVTKQIDCEDQTEGDCEDLLELVNENDYIFQVEGNNPDPSSPFLVPLPGQMLHWVQVIILYQKQKARCLMKTSKLLLILTQGGQSLFPYHRLQEIVLEPVRKQQEQ